MVRKRNPIVPQIIITYIGKLAVKSPKLMFIQINTVIVFKEEQPLRK
jgi:hypothetical protein